MDQNFKTCLIVVASLAFLLGLVMVGSVTLIYLNRDKIQQGIDKMSDNLERYAEQGEEFGRETDQQGCLDEALKRSEGKGAFSAIGSSTWFEGCLKAAAEREGFCDDAPKPTEILSMAMWPQKQCAALGRMNEQGCIQVAQAKLEYCLQRRAE